MKKNDDFLAGTEFGQLPIYNASMIIQSENCNSRWFFPPDGQLPKMSVLTKRRDNETLNLPPKKEICQKPKPNLRFLILFKYTLKG